MEQWKIKKKHACVLLLWYLLPSAGCTAVIPPFCLQLSRNRHCNYCRIVTVCPGCKQTRWARDGSGPDGLRSQQVCCLQHSRVVRVADVSRLEGGVWEWKRSMHRLCCDCLASWLCFCLTLPWEGAASSTWPAKPLKHVPGSALHFALPSLLPAFKPSGLPKTRIT